MFERSINGKPASRFPTDRAFGGPSESRSQHLVVLTTACRTTAIKTFKADDWSRWCQNSKSFVVNANEPLRASCNVNAKRLIRDRRISCFAGLPGRSIIRRIRPP
jgi:hypothetical protein